MATSEIRSSQLFFDPDLHPDCTLKAFDEFIQTFQLRYNAQYPDPPKVSMDAAIERWKIANEEVKPTIQQYDQIRNEWRSKDQVAKFLGIFSSKRMYIDWMAAEPNEEIRSNTTWKNFVHTMQQYYKPTENSTLKHFTFRSLTQENDETFSAFCNRVDKEAKHCQFKCQHDDCTAENTAIRDQIIIGMTSDKIREEALKKSWDLQTLRKQGMQMESAEKGVAEISGEHPLQKVGKYSFRAMREKSQSTQKQHPKQRPSCYFCGTEIATTISKHLEICKARNSRCRNCRKIGHYESVCRSKKNVQEIKTGEEVSSSNIGHDYDADNKDEVYNINIFQVNKENQHVCGDFKVQVIINNNLATILADTGASISVCGIKEARRWDLLGRMISSRAKIKPYNSPIIPIEGVARCAVTFEGISVPVEWNIIKGPCEPILSGKIAEQLRIIKFNRGQEVFHPLLMIHAKNKQPLQEILKRFPNNFAGLGKMKGHQVKLYVDPSIKPVATPPRPVPYHLKERTQKAIEEMIGQDVIEEHPASEPAPWISNAVIAPKANGEIRVTLDARNVNKAIQTSNFPIPRQEDIKARLTGATVFSKLDFKSAFWQLELHPQSRYLTVFHANGKLYRYKRLTMGVKPAQAELNSALQPLFTHIPQAHLIHDDLIIAGRTTEEHDDAVEKVMLTISGSGLTLNASKCTFGQPEIEFWGLRISANGIHPDPAKVDALNHITPPTNKEELRSFLCMMQSNADFIPNFAKRTAILRELTKVNTHFQWNEDHQQCYNNLIQSFRRDALLQYFDLGKKIFIFTDAHKTGFGAMLAQGNSKEDARPVAFASRTTNKAELQYPQIDLEAMGIDFALRRFRNYLVGSPTKIEIITDHQPLCSIFNGKRQGSIRTDRIKLRHQDIPYVVTYQQGKINQADYLSRHAKPINLLPQEQQKEAEDLNNLLYMLHTTPVVDHLSIAKISHATGEDPNLQQLRRYIKEGKTYIPKTESEKLQKFQKILHELTLTGNGIILKGERIVLPEKLQEKAVQLAHRGAHPGQSGLERRLRYHFFFHDMAKKVQKVVTECQDCSTFVDNKISEPIKHHKVPERCWDTVAVDLYGPMPSSKHVVVVQDLASRFPTAKLVTSTSADKVLPVLGEIYDTYGNPEVQISDNGPPFNSAKMKAFAEKRDITLRKIPPLHPSSNPVETFMRPLGKAMKIGHRNAVPEKETLKAVLDSYQHTPHPATAIPPAAMLFRDNHRSNLPRRTITTEEIQRAKQRDLLLKRKNQQKINSSKYKNKVMYDIGDTVLIRNFKKKSKFDPVFMPEPYQITDINQEANKIKVEQNEDKSILYRHPDDIKPFKAALIPTTKNQNVEAEEVRKWCELCTEALESDDAYDNDNEDEEHDNEVEIQSEQESDDRVMLRRSRRQHVANRRYYNEHFIN